MIKSKKHLVVINFDIPGYGWRQWTGLVPETNGKCIVYPNQIFKRLTGVDMPAHTRFYAS